MPARIKSITFDCTDPFRLAEFWSQLTDFDEEPDNRNAPEDPEALLLSPDGSLALLFIAVPEPKQVKNRLHLDLVPVRCRRDDQVDELLGIGARLVADMRRPDGAGWVVLADPEGNEFCVERSDAERAPLPPEPAQGPSDSASRTLHRGVVLSVEEDACVIVGDGRRRCVGYASTLPTPRTARISPGHLVAVTTAPDGSEVVIWRWYDAVVVGDDGDQVRLWEPAHGDVVAQRRDERRFVPGSRAYLSAGLPGADWWVAAGTTDRAEDADVELDEVRRLYTDHDLWHSLA